MDRTTTTTKSDTSRAHLPPELTRKILVMVFADSVHRVCVSSRSTSSGGGRGAFGMVDESAAVVKWEMDVVGTLSAVCYAFREIVNDVGRKAFRLREGASVPRGVRTKLTTLRGVAGECWRARDAAGPAPTQTFVDALSRLAERAPLPHAYVVWLACGVLRMIAARTSDGALFLQLHGAVGNLLALSRARCAHVEPREMASPLVCRLESDLDAVAMLTELVKARIDIENLLRLFCRLADVDDIDGDAEARKELRQSIQASIDENIRKVEEADLFNDARPSVFLLDDIYNEVQLPLLLDALVSCGRAQFEPPEYCESIRLRVDEILVAYVHIQRKYPLF